MSLLKLNLNPINLIYKLFKIYYTINKWYKLIATNLELIKYIFYCNFKQRIFTNHFPLSMKDVIYPQLLILKLCNAKHHNERLMYY